MRVSKEIKNEFVAQDLFYLFIHSFIYLTHDMQIYEPTHH